MAERSLTLRTDQEAQTLFGKHDQHLRRIEQALGIAIVARGAELKLSGADEGAVANALRLFDDLLVVVRAGAPLRKDDVEYALHALTEKGSTPLRQIYH